MKKKVLIISADQFGYLTDTLKYCEYSREEFDITYVGWDYGRPRIEMDGIRIRYVSRKQNLFVRNFRLLRTFHSEIRRGYDVIFASYTRGISLVKLLNYRANFILDIRTLGVNPGRFRRWVYDVFLKFESLFFNRISVISEGVGQRLRLGHCFVLPMGGDCFSRSPKSFRKLSLLYVGSLQHRNILDCVKGFHQYLKYSGENGDPPVFTIVGDSPGGELTEIREYIRSNFLENHVVTTGAVPHNRLTPYFDQANIGVSYIPLRPYYNFQPPTKTYEYLISGLPVIATSTFENSRLVSGDSGVLTADSVHSFFMGLENIHRIRSGFDSERIRQKYAHLSWENIVTKAFRPLIRSACNGSDVL